METIKTFLSLTFLLALLTIMGWSTIEYPPTPVGIDYGRIVHMSAKELAIQTAETNARMKEVAK